MQEIIIIEDNFNANKRSEEYLEKRIESSVLRTQANRLDQVITQVEFANCQASLQEQVKIVQFRLRDNL